MNENVFKCGAAKRKITPSDEDMPDLFGLMRIKFGGVMDDIYVRVIAVNDGENTALLISFDLDKAPLPEKEIPELSSKYGIPEENIIYIGIHTHSAPVCGNRPLNAGEDRMSRDPAERDATLRYENFVMKQLDEAVRESLNNMRPAKMSYGYGKSYVNINRNQDYAEEMEDGTIQMRGFLGCNNEAPVDRTLFVCRFTDAEDKPIAFFINYPVHNVVTIGNSSAPDGKTAITGDLGGRASAYTEQAWPGSVAVWSSGAAGDFNVCMSTQMQYPDPVTGAPVQVYMKDPQAPKMMLDLVSARHFADIKSVIRGMDSFEVPSKIIGVTEWSETPARDVISHGWNEPSEYNYEGVKEPYRIRLHLLRIGTLALFGVSGELYSALGRLIKENAALKNTVVLNHDATLICDAGYIYDDEQFRHSREVKGGALGIGMTRALPGYIEDSLREHTRSMFEKLGL